MTITKYGIAPDAEDFEKSAAEGTEETAKPVPPSVNLCKCGMPKLAAHSCSTPNHPPVNVNGATSSTT